MGCCPYYEYTESGDTAFSVDVSAITFGSGCLREIGDRATSLQLKRVALVTDKTLRSLEHLALAE